MTTPGMVIAIEKPWGMSPEETEKYVETPVGMVPDAFLSVEAAFYNKLSK